MNMMWNNCVFLPAVGKQTQFLHIIFTEPGKVILEVPFNYRAQRSPACKSGRGRRRQSRPWAPEVPPVRFVQTTKRVRANQFYGCEFYCGDRTPVRSLIQQCYRDHWCRQHWLPPPASGIHGMNLKLIMMVILMADLKEEQKCPSRTYSGDAS